MSVNVKLRGPTFVRPNEKLQVGIYLLGAGEKVIAGDFIFNWNPELLDFQGHNIDGAVASIATWIPTRDSFSFINESDPPKNGNAYLVWFGELGNPAEIPDNGLLISTLEFIASPVTSNIEVGISQSVLRPGTTRSLVTKVFGAASPNLIVTGELNGYRGQIQNVEQDLAKEINVLKVKLSQIRTLADTNDVA